MDYRFREIRKGECPDVIAFAKTNGAAIKPEALHHHLSLGAKKDGELAAAALCIEHQPHQFVIEIVHREGVEQSLVTELADRCLRKVQSEGIASARISSPAESATQTIWQQTNWLNDIQETPPPTEADAETPADSAEPQDNATQAA
jgi:hypothetical protein